MTTETSYDLDRIRKEFPAKFTPTILDRIADELRVRMLADPLILDPFAGIGGVHGLRDRYPCRTVGIDLEPEFAACHPDTLCGDSRHAGSLLFDAGVGRPDVLVTSPAYGNRFADQYLGSDTEKCRDCKGLGQITSSTYPPSLCKRCDGSGNAPSKRANYAIAKGATLTPGSGAALQWGQRYRETHELIVRRLVADIGAPLWIVNVSSSIRGEGYVPVTEWWVTMLARYLTVVDLVAVETPRMGFGANGDARVPVEHIIVAEARDA